MTKSKQLMENISGDLESALRSAKALADTDDIDSPSYDWQQRLVRAIRDALDLL